MVHRIIPAIMSGGAGTRLWPMSTENAPKQFHALTGEATLFEQTLARVARDVGGLSFAPPIIIANARHEREVDAGLARANVQPGAVVFETKGRNTAAAGAIAALVAQELEPGALVLLLPADHVITDADAFIAAIARAAAHARERIVTFGITPDRPATGYGYIKSGEALSPGVNAIESFREKPVREVAEAYLSEGGYSWNAGVFLFSPEVMLQEFAGAPEIREGARAALAAARREGAKMWPDPALFEQIPSEPLDIAVMEKTARGAVAPCDIGWADIGAWDEVWRLGQGDEAGNVIQGRAAVLDGARNLVRSDGPKVCVAGVEDLIVVATGDAVLILPRSRAQDVAKLIALSKTID